MKHLELSEGYFREYGHPMIEKGFPQLAENYAAGMAGEGSGCLGFDDQYSEDHDFGPGFCIWLSDEDYEKYGKELQSAYEALPYEYMGYSRSNIIDESRLGVMRTSDFFSSFTGCPDIPGSNMDWFLISETNLCAVTGGRVFQDKKGDFTRIRNGYIKFYPHDVLLKKLAARCAVIAQSGQYNFGRCLKRGDKVAASLAMTRFAEAVMSMLYLLNSKPMPFYKWAFRGLESFSHDEDILTIKEQLSALLSKGPNPEGILRIEGICGNLINMLISHGYAEPAGYFMQDYVPQLMAKIQDPQLASMHPMADCL